MSLKIILILSSNLQLAFPNGPFLRKDRNIYRVFVGRPDGNRPIVSLRRRWADNIKMNIQKRGCDDVDRIDLAQVRYNKLWAVLNAVMNFLPP
jgi:hypothetical protein